ncbi:MAG: hypothetical protein PHE55_06310 [Methylococcaceae bacterium]|nr:hypothetical protein [Methylococcaceae bacterium]
MVGIAHASQGFGEAHEGITIVITLKFPAAKIIPCLIEVLWKLAKQLAGPMKVLRLSFKALAAPIKLYHCQFRFRQCQ